jgi:competence protein ComEC
MSFGILAFVLRVRAAFASLTFAMCAASMLGFVLAGHAARGALAVSVPLNSKGPMVCEGRVAGDSVNGRWGWKFDLDLVSCDADGTRAAAFGRVRASARHRFVGEGLLPGEVVRAPFVFKTPREFKKRGSFSYGRYLMSRGVGAVAYARGDLERVRLASGFAAAIGRWRAGLQGAIRGSVPPREAQVVEALATGMRSQLDEGMRESFSRAGIAHLLAISGLHVGYVALMIYLLVRATLGRVPAIVSRMPLRRISAMVALPLVWLYIAFVGFPMSGVRAGLMLSVYFLGVIAGFRQDALTTLAAAVIAVLVWMPLSVLDISFQLSVVAVLGIIVAALPMMRRVDGRFCRSGFIGAFMRRAFAIVAVSVSAALFTAPLVAYHFGTFTLLGPITNLVAVPLVAFGLMPAILLATLLAPVASWAANLAFKFSSLLSGVLIDLAERVSDAGSSLTGYASPTAWEMALAYAAIALLLALRALPRRFSD